MYQRLRRSAIGFGVVMAAFTVYRVAAVPFLEPAVAAPTHTPDQRTYAPKPAGDPLLSRIFPPGSWQLSDPLKLENDHSQLLMESYENLPDGRVKMAPCTIVFFPGNEPESDDEPLGRVIVLDAPLVVAQFDQPLDLKNAKIGRLLGAQFIGPVQIRGTPSRPGAADDIFVTTHDVQMTTDVISTPSPVDFRMGQSTGHGRDLRMQLAPSSGGGGRGPGIGGVQSIELQHDVQMRLISTSGSVMPMDARNRDERAAATAGPQRSANANSQPAVPTAPRPGLPAPVADLAAQERRQLPPAPTAPAAKAAKQQNLPVDVRCKGKFRFDMTSYVATFENQVDVVQTPHDGPSDDMSCEELLVHFAPRATPPKSGTAGTASTDQKNGNIPGGQAPSDQPATSSQKIPNLEPRRIEARGNPVIVRAPSSNSYARGQHLDYEIQSRHIKLDAAPGGGDEAMMQQQVNEIHARKIDYLPGEQGQLGTLTAIGPGWLRGQPPKSAKPQTGGQSLGDAAQQPPFGPMPFAQPPSDASAAAQPPQLFEAHWSSKLRMRPFQGEHVISIEGDAQAEFTGQGKLSANEIWMWVFEPAPVDKSQPGPQPKSQVQPDRMQAIGNVRIDSPQLTGACAKLQAWFQQAPPSALTPAGPLAMDGVATGRLVGFQQASDGRADSGRNSPAPNAVAASAPQPDNPAPTDAAPADRPLNSFLPSFGGAGHGQPSQPKSRYYVNGQLIRVQLLTRPEATTVEDLNVDGQAHLEEIQTPEPGDEPLRINGDSLQVTRASEPDTAVTIGGHPAQAASRGLEMYGDAIQLNKGTNRLWIDGAGHMKLPANQVANDDSFGFGGPSAGTRSATQPGGSQQPQQPSQPIYIDWQGRMAFDGMLARFERSVVCQSDTRTLRTELLDCTMSQRVDFSQRQSGQRAEVGRILCPGDVLMESRGLDPMHVLVNVERMFAHNLSVDKITGRIDGQGPGWLTSVRRGAQQDPAAMSPLGLPAGRQAAEPVIRPTSQTGAAPAQFGQRPVAAGAFGRGGPQQRGAPDPNQLTYLNVQFQGPITGNLNNHEITFNDQIRAIDGPVLNWGDQLNFDKLENLAPGDELMNCDHLTLRQGPVMPQPGNPNHRAMEMEAVGNVSVEGATYRALSDRMTYSEAKDMLALHGDGRNYARLYRQERVGAPPDETVARDIFYWRTADRAEVSDFKFGDFEQGGSAPAPQSLTGDKPPATPGQNANKKPGTPPPTGAIP